MRFCITYEENNVSLEWSSVWCLERTIVDEMSIEVTIETRAQKPVSCSGITSTSVGIVAVSSRDDDIGSCSCSSSCISTSCLLLLISAWNYNTCTGHSRGHRNLIGHCPVANILVASSVEPVSTIQPRGFQLVDHSTLTSGVVIMILNDVQI